jgi:AhpD family alkylhydroperoxidase
MPYVAPLGDAQAPENVKSVFQMLQTKLGKVLNIFRTMGYAPDVLNATLAMNQAIQHQLDPKLRELAYLRASQVNECGYCLHYHKGLGQKAGVTEAQIAALPNFESSNLFNDQEKDVLRFSEQWTRRGRVAPEVMQRLTKSLTPGQMIVLAATAGLANWTNRFNETFGIELP